MKSIDNLHRHYRIKKVADMQSRTVKEHLYVEGYVQAMKDYGVLLFDVPIEKLSENFRVALYDKANDALAKW